MMSRNLVLITLLLGGYLFSCNQPSHWQKIQPGISFTLDKIDSDKTGKFRFTSAVVVTGKDVFIKAVNADSLARTLNGVFALDEVSQWRINLAKGAVGKLKINTDTFFLQLLAEQPCQLFLNDSVSDETVRSDSNWLSRQTFIRKVMFKSKEEAMNDWLKGGQEDFREFLGTNLLPASFDLYIKMPYFNAKSLDSINELLKSRIKSGVQFSFPRSAFGISTGFYCVFKFHN